jgi:hypothetical protein
MPIPELVIKTGTTSIEGATVKGDFSYFSGSTLDLGPTSLTGLRSGVNAPSGGYTVYQVGGNSWTARVAANDTDLNSILISAGATGSNLNERINWASNTNSVLINSGTTQLQVGDLYGGGTIAYILQSGDSGYNPNVQHGYIFSLGTTLSEPPYYGFANWGNASSTVTNYRGGGFSDWNLPTASEWSKVYPNRLIFQGGLFAYFYWGSPVGTAFNGSVIYNGFNPANNFYFRALRSF